MHRENITFPSGNASCAGWFLTPDGPGPHPTVVMAHGLAGVKEMRLDAFAERFAAAGFAVLVFDYRHFGASGGDPRQLLSIRKQHQDWRAAVAHARSRPGVDGKRLALWGYSLSGGHVIALADEVGAAAFTAQMPHVDGIASVLAVPPRTLVRLVGHGLRDLVGSLLRRPPRYVPAIGKPGELALLTAPESMRYVELVPPGADFDTRVAARFALAIGLWSPGRRLRKSRVPALIQVGTKDRVTPADPVVKAARKAIVATVSTYDADHFDPCVGDFFELFVAEQIAFLDKQLS